MSFMENISSRIVRRFVYIFLLTIIGRKLLTIVEIQDRLGCCRTTAYAYSNAVKALTSEMGFDLD